MLNTRGGQGLIDNYFGPNSNGNGNLTTVGVQYDLSIGRLVSYPVPFSGDGPDLFVSLFGMMVHVNSDDKIHDAERPLLRQRHQAEVRRRGDLQRPVVGGAVGPLRQRGHRPRTTTQLTRSRWCRRAVILRTDWQATDQLVIQYSHWFNGANTCSASAIRRCENVLPVPDTDMISISANMWW